MKKEELIAKIRTLDKNVFTLNDLVNFFPEDSSHIKTIIKRFKDSNVLFPILRGVYALDKGSVDVEKIATSIYTPSYVSFESVLSKYGIMNQGLYQVNLATTRHSKRMEIGGVTCVYSQISTRLFFGFNLLNDVFIADPEKAVLDTLYLKALGKKEISTAEWDIKNLNKAKIFKYAKVFGGATEKLARSVFS
jgi:predicted transcriptional regulator of viral defense system